MKACESYTDQELLALIKKGDEIAFAHLYDQYWKKLYFVAVKKLENEADAEEVVQDIFLTLWKNRDRFELLGKFENYFAVAVKFQVIKRRAMRHRRSEVERLLTDEANRVLLDGGYQELNQYDLDYLQARLAEAIAELPKKCQLVFKMSRNEDYSNKQIAKELGITEKAVEKHITKAIKRLRSKLSTNIILILLLNNLF